VVLHTQLGRVVAFAAVLMEEGGGRHFGAAVEGEGHFDSCRLDGHQSLRAWLAFQVVGLASVTPLEQVVRPTSVVLGVRCH
jgi:hypothetical protein